MPFLSAFTPFGLLACSSRPSPAQQIFEALVAAYGPGFSSADGTHIGAKCYATARTLAAAAATVERGANQRDPLETREMLPAMERQYGIVPQATDTPDDRRRFLAAKYIASKGFTPSNALLALTTLLGSDLRAIVYNALHDIEPAAPELGPGTFPRNDVVQRRFTFVDPVCGIATGTGTAQSFRYAPEIPGDRLRPGDIVAAAYGSWALSEKIEITAAAEPTTSGGYPTASAVFAKAKERGSCIWTGPRPMWASAARTTVIIASAAAATDPETRRKVGEVMALMTTGVSTWAFVEQDSSGLRQTNFFDLDSNHLDSDTFEPIAF